MNPELAAFRSVDFHGVRRLKEVWQDGPRAEDILHSTAMESYKDAIDRLRERGENQCGLVFTGPAGSGKTHLLGQIRKHALANDNYFVLVNCTDILHFWPTLALQYLQSLQQEYLTPGGSKQTQIEVVLGTLMDRISKSVSAGTLLELYTMERDDLVRLASEVVASLRVPYWTRMKRHGTVRALFYLHSGEQALSDLAYAYLQGQTLDSIPEVTGVNLGGANSPPEVVSDLAWLMSLSRPTVLAFDQFDPIITQHRLLAADENHESHAVIVGLVNGLMSLMEKLARTQPILGLLESSWETLHKYGLDSATDRFEPAIPLAPPRRSRDVYRSIVVQRLERAYAAKNFKLHNPPWPIEESFFDSLEGLIPRDVLKRCELHRQQCLAAGTVSALQSYQQGFGPPPPPPPPNGLQEAFLELVGAANVEGMKGEDNEDRLGQLLSEVCKLFRQELPSDPDIDFEIDTEFNESKQYKSLHVRLARLFRKESDREEHLCLRVLEKKHHAAFQCRLRAALTMSGVKEGLPGRALVVLRNAPIPGGPTTEKLAREFHGSGGRIETLLDEDLKVILALPKLQGLYPDKFEEWQRQAKPLSHTQLFKKLVPDWLGSKSPPRPEPPIPPVAPVPDRTGRQSEPTVTRHSTSQATPTKAILIGLRDGLPSSPVEIPPLDLTRHVVIRAGSGGGKTVLLKRLVEEAALAGVSSIVIDSARDLSYLGDSWPESPDGWLVDDAERARRYKQDVKVCIWTPGRADGRPMFLSPLPDFRKSFDDQYEFDQAIQIATSGLGDRLAKRRNSAQAMAVLQAAVKHFGASRGHELKAFADLLQELPDSAMPNISKAPKLARDMGDELHALILRDPMLSPSGKPVDIGELFGAGGGVPTVSVISLFALSDLSSQAAFIGRLGLAIFEWIRRNPTVNGIRGLFVIDEAAPFLPRYSSESKAALLLLCQQARKYGVGLLMATQNPKDLDYNATAQFSTQFFGTANQPQVVSFIREVMEGRGMRSLNPGVLKPGEFYVSSPSMTQPIKLRAPMCLSWHPRNRTLTDEEILELARRC
jgi:DNA helicase HerA-like ATPase